MDCYERKDNNAHIAFTFSLLYFKERTMEYYLTAKGYPNYEVSNLGNVRNRKTGTYRKHKIVFY